MRKFVLLCTSLCAMVLISASPVRAQNVLWVSASGSNANVCTQAAPCATFQGAISKGNVSQINCLGSGNYGPFTVTASITVDCGSGNIGEIFVTVNSAITINTAAAATIVLRHLSLNGGGNAVAGINTAAFNSGTLIVEDCTVQGFLQGNGYGILFSPSAGRGLLQVSNSQMSGNINGIRVQPTNGQIASLALNRVELTANSSVGLSMGGSGVVAGTLRDSLVGANDFGVYTTASQTYLTVEQSSIVANISYGIQINSAGSIVNVGGSTIGGNGTGVKAFFGSLISFGNNQMSANGSNGSFTATAPLQ